MFWSRRSAALGLYLLLLPAVAEASDLRTYPTRLTLAPGAAIGSLMLRNNDTTKALMQVEALRWYQENGEDKYEPTRDLLINPVIFEVAPGAEQVVRVGLQVGAADVERSYRVFLQEVTAQDVPPKAGINTLLRIGIPIFVPPARTNLDLNWDAKAAGDKKLSIGVTNTGSTHVQMTAFTLSRSSGQAVGKGNIFLYVLPGQTRRWDAALETPISTGEPLHLDIETDAGGLKSDIAVGGPAAKAVPK